MMEYELLNLDMPSYEEMSNMNKAERINFYRCFFAHSRYNRLIIQLFMIDSAINNSSFSFVSKLQNQNLFDFDIKIKHIKKSSFYLEFLETLKEEDEALKKIIDAYNNKLNQNLLKRK
jgi:hypothetical protein